MNNNIKKWYKDRTFVLGCLTLLIVGIGGIVTWWIDRHYPNESNDILPKDRTIEQGNNSTYNENPVEIHNYSSSKPRSEHIGAISITSPLQLHSLELLEIELNQNYNASKDHYININFPRIQNYKESFHTNGGTISFSLNNVLCLNIKVDKSKVLTQSEINNYFNELILTSFKTEHLKKKLLQCIN